MDRAVRVNLLQVQVHQALREVPVLETQAQAKDRTVIQALLAVLAMEIKAQVVDLMAIVAEVLEAVLMEMEVQVAVDLMETNLRNQFIQLDQC